MLIARYQLVWLLITCSLWILQFIGSWSCCTTRNELIRQYRQLQQIHRRLLLCRGSRSPSSGQSWPTGWPPCSTPSLSSWPTGPSARTSRSRTPKSTAGTQSGCSHIWSVSQSGESLNNRVTWHKGNICCSNLRLWFYSREALNLSLKWVLKSLPYSVIILEKT